MTQPCGGQEPRKLLRRGWADRFQSSSSGPRHRGEPRQNVAGNILFHLNRNTLLLLFTKNLNVPHLVETSSVKQKQNFRHGKERKFLLGFLSGNMCRETPEENIFRRCFNLFYHVFSRVDFSPTMIPTDTDLGPTFSRFLSIAHIGTRKGQIITGVYFAVIIC